MPARCPRPKHNNKNTNLDMIWSQVQQNAVGVSMWRLSESASVHAWKCPTLWLSPELIQKVVVPLACQIQAVMVHLKFSVAERWMLHEIPLCYKITPEERAWCQCLPFIPLFQQVEALSQQSSRENMAPADKHSIWGGMLSTPPLVLWTTFTEGAEK